MHTHSVRQHKENEGIGRVDILVNPNQMKSSKTHEAQRNEKKTVARHMQLDEKKDREKQTQTEQPLTIANNPKTTTKPRTDGRAKTKRVLVKNTPVDLYQKYKSDWEKFKKYIPGENTREEVRREVRTRVQKPPPPKPTVS